MRKPRLRRLEWVYTNSPVYFVTTCCEQRRALLCNEPVHQAFRNFCENAGQRGVYVGRYVLMPDHVHLFAAFASTAPPLSNWMKALKRSLWPVRKDDGAERVFWQKGFFDHVIRSAESYEEKWHYVRLNPVRAGLVRSAEEWPYQGEFHVLGL